MRQSRAAYAVDCRKIQSRDAPVWIARAAKAILDRRCGCREMSETMGYGVIGSTTDSGSVSLGSSPGTPARFGLPRRPPVRLPPRYFTVMAPLCSGLARRPLKAVARVRIPSGLRQSASHLQRCRCGALSSAQLPRPWAARTATLARCTQLTETPECLLSQWRGEYVRGLGEVRMIGGWLRC